MFSPVAQSGSRNVPHWCCPDKWLHKLFGLHACAVCVQFLHKCNTCLVSETCAIYLSSFSIYAIPSSFTFWACAILFHFSSFVLVQFLQMCNACPVSVQEQCKHCVWPHSCNKHAVFILTNLVTLQRTLSFLASAAENTPDSKRLTEAMIRKTNKQTDKKPYSLWPIHYWLNASLTWWTFADKTDVGTEEGVWSQVLVSEA